jgi:ABC-type uncharacterized transport system substrate-binding protein
VLFRSEFGNALGKILSDNKLTHAEIELSMPIPDSGASQNSGLVIAVGTKAATAVAASKATSVLNVFISKSGYEKLLRDFPHRSGSHTFSAIFLDHPITRQIHLINAILPGKKNIGLLYSSPPNEIEKLRNELAEHGLTLLEQMATPAHPLAEALQEIAQNSDALLALPDSAIYNNSTIRNILLETYRNNIPLIGISSAYVKAGALCAVISTPTQIAIQAAELAKQFNTTHTLPAAQYPQEFDVMVNEQIARSLGLRIRSVSVLHDIIRNNDRSQP